MTYQQVPHGGQDFALSFTFLKLVASNNPSKWKWIVRNLSFLCWRLFGFGRSCCCHHQKNIFRRSNWFANLSFFVPYKSLVVRTSSLKNVYILVSIYRPGKVCESEISASISICFFFEEFSSCMHLSRRKGIRVRNRMHPLQRASPVSFGWFIDQQLLIHICSLDKNIMNINCMENITNNKRNKHHQLNITSMSRLIWLFYWSRTPIRSMLAI